MFTHLHLHSEYSVVDSLIRLDPLIETIKKQGGESIALTDQSNLFATVKFYRAAERLGIKPIIGADVWLSNEQDPHHPYQLILLCQSPQGYKNLLELVSRSYVEGQQYDKPQLNKTWLAERHQGLIAIASSRTSDVAQALLSENQALAEDLFDQWSCLFPDRFYLELTRVHQADEEVYIQEAIRLAEKKGCPVVASNNVRFLHKSDFEAHEARVCIHDGYTLNNSDRPKRYSEEQYLKTPEQMQALFSDIPEALANTVEIAKRCNFELTLNQVYLPNYPVPEDTSIDDYLKQEAEQGLQSVFEEKQIPENYQARLSEELSVLTTMGYAGYFLIVADFIRWAKKNKIPVGPGRGSGAGSLVAYTLGITGIDPLQYDLLFERFLNPERVSMPDFDIDFCMDGRDRVIDYVAQTYGRDSVSQIITYGTMAAKAVVRDVGRVLGHPYGFVDKIAKLIPFELGITLDKALQNEEMLRERYEKEEEVKTLLDLAKKLEGLTRNAGKHAGGVVIAPSKLTDFTPLYCDPKDGVLLTQFDKNDIETIGLVKFDFLGLRTLTIIDWAIHNVNAIREKNQQESVDINQIPLDDPKVFTLLRSCKTTGIFQLESSGMKDLLKRLKPDNFEEIIALVALFRPGPLQSGMVDDFINRKHGRSAPEYLHPKLVGTLKPTYGIILYQEQVMQIAQILAGYTLGGADLLRRAMGKKKPEEMAKQRAIFVKGSVERGVEEARATHIFDLMEKFAGYGFNKSHSAAYALITYQTAWLKAHYKEAFMAAVLSSDMAHTDKVVIFIRECRVLKIAVIGPRINQSHYKFSVDEKNQIIYGLGAIKGVGESAIHNIVEARQKGSFSSLLDFVSRVDPRKVSKRCVEALIRCGAFDEFGKERSALMANVENIMSIVEQSQQDDLHGQGDLFGNSIDASPENTLDFDSTAPWPEAIRLTGEKETLGLYLSGHPLDAFEEDLSQIRTCTIHELKAGKTKKQVIAGLIVGLKHTVTRKGDRIAFVTLDDGTGTQEIVVFSDLYQSYRELFVKDNLIVVEGEVSTDNFSGGYRMRAQSVCSFDQSRMKAVKHVKVFVNAKEVSEHLPAQLTDLFRSHQGQGGCPVQLFYRRDGTQVQLRLGEGWRVLPATHLLDSLKDLSGIESVELQY